MPLTAGEVVDYFVDHASSDADCSYSELRGVCGAYILKHKPTGSIYVGSTSDLYNRKTKHLTQLKAGSHWNVNLQALFTGEEEIIFLFILTDTRDEAYVHEQQLLNVYKDFPMLLNIALDAKAPMAGRSHTEETKDRMRLSSPRSNLGVRFTDEHKARISKATLGRGLGVPRPPEATTGLRLTNAAKSKQVSVDNVTYESINAAARAIGIDGSTLAYRVRSDNFPHYFHP